MERVLITGAGRGLGLEFVKQYAARGDLVFAAVRQPEEALQLKELQRQYCDHLFIVEMDLTDFPSICRAHGTIQMHSKGLDILINNAGINRTRTDQVLGQLDMDQILFMFRVNAVAPLLVAQCFLDFLQAGNKPRIASISSERGSISLKSNGGNYGYTASKTALNMLMRTLAFDILPLGIVTVILDPGWVHTDMGGPRAILTPEESVRGLLKVIDTLTEVHAGRFLTWKGCELPW